MENMEKTADQQEVKEEVWEAKAAFGIRTGVKEIYHFLLNYSYTTLSGLIGLGISLIAGVWLITHLHTLNANGILFCLLLFLLYTVVNPLLLWSKAKKQVKNSSYFSKPLVYELSEQGITIRSEDQHMQVEWKAIVKVKEFGNLIVVYVSKINAFIWAKDQMEDAEQVKEILKHHINEKRLKLKR